MTEFAKNWLGKIIFQFQRKSGKKSRYITNHNLIKSYPFELCFLVNSLYLESQFKKNQSQFFRGAVSWVTPQQFF